MEIFGVGILEVVLILVIAVIVLGPEGMVKTARSAGVWIRKIIKSPIWSQLMDTQRELRQMPTRLVREAGLEEDIKELKKTQQQIRNLDITGGEFIKKTITTAVTNDDAPEKKAEGSTPAVEVGEQPTPETEDHTIAPPEIHTKTGPVEAENHDEKQA